MTPHLIISKWSIFLFLHLEDVKIKVENISYTYTPHGIILFPFLRIFVFWYAFLSFFMGHFTLFCWYYKITTKSLWLNPYDPITMGKLPNINTNLEFYHAAYKVQSWLIANCSKFAFFIGTFCPSRTSYKIGTIFAWANGNGNNWKALMLCTLLIMLSM